MRTYLVHFAVVLENGSHRVGSPEVPAESALDALKIVEAQIAACTQLSAQPVALALRSCESWSRPALAA